MGRSFEASLRSLVADPDRFLKLVAVDGPGQQLEGRGRATHLLDGRDDLRTETAGILARPAGQPVDRHPDDHQPDGTVAAADSTVA